MIELKLYLDPADYDLLNLARGGESRSGYVRRILQGEWNRHPPVRRTIGQLKDEALRRFIAEEVAKQVREHLHAFPVRENGLEGK